MFNIICFVRINSDTEGGDKSRDSAAENVMMSYKRDLQREFEKIFEDIIRQLKDNPTRYKRNANMDRFYGRNGESEVKYRLRFKNCR